MTRRVILLSVAFFTSCLNSFSQSQDSVKLEVNSTGLFLNSKNIITQTTPTQIQDILGAPDRIFNLRNTIWVYDNLGLKIYIDSTKTFLKSIEFDFKKGTHKFSPIRQFSGEFKVFGIKITEETLPSTIKKIKEITFEDSLFPVYYMGTANYLKFVFIYFNDMLTIDNVGISINK